VGSTPTLGTITSLTISTTSIKLSRKNDVGSKYANGAKMVT